MARIFSTDYLQSSSQVYAPLIGVPTRFGALEVDGAVNLIDTNLTLFVSSGNLRDVKIICCNRSDDPAEIRIAHIDGAIGAIVDADYLFYDVVLYPKETKILTIDGMESGDTIMVYSDIIDVTFMADGQTMDADYGYKRLDATVVVADTDTALHTSIGPTENITVVACNKDRTEVAYIRIAIIDAAVIGSLSDEDYIIFDALLQPLESKTYNLELDVPVNYTIGVRSTNALVNYVAYGRIQ